MKRKKGFTLIETLVYLGLFSFIMVALLASAFNLFRNMDRTETKAMLQEEGDFLLSKIDWALTGASNVTSPAVGSPSNTLTLTKEGSSLTFSLNGTDLQLEGVILNNSNVKVTTASFTFSHTGSASNPESITALFTLNTNTSSGQSISEDFQTTKYLRK